MIVSVPNKPATPHMTIRVPVELRQAAQAKAAENGETISDVIRRALEQYVAGGAS